MNIFERVKNILVSPKTEWEVIKNEQSTIADLFTKYALVLALIPAIAGFIGQSLVGISLGPFGSFKVPIVNGLIYLVLFYVLSLAGIYLVAIIIDALAPSFGGQKDMVSSLKVVVYSYTAVWISGIFQIIPMLSILGILGLYSLYLLYLGLNIVKGSPSDKVVGYTVVVIVITIVIYFIIGAIVGAIALGGVMMDAMKVY